MTDAEVYAMIDSLGDVGRKLAKARTDSLAGLYEALNLAVRYEHDSQAVQVTIQPVMRVNSVRVRGGIDHYAHALYRRNHFELP
ncbi:hypothetical protein [Amycolatopsis tucumanensis]|uniref:Uncharacterized protein n=1 Tax=Amycolatopsis tucumanensis TaxID=401106 RepID=A0ABP7HRK6_9PSEU